ATVVPWSAPPSGSRWACWCWLCRWRCSGRSTWTPSRPRCCPMTPPRWPTTPSWPTCAWGYAVLVLALGVAAGAFLSGPSTTAVGTRQRLTAAIGRLRGGAGEARLRTGPVGTWVDGKKQLLRIGLVTTAALALVFWGQPPGKGVL